MSHSGAGFSFIEVMLAMGLMALVLSGVLGLLFGSQAAFVDRQDEAAVRQAARIGLHHLADELRLAGFRAGKLDDVTLASEYAVAFVADVDDGASAAPCTDESPSAPTPERVSYEAREDGTLWRRVECNKGNGNGWTVGADWTRVAVGVDTSAPVFRYFDAQGREVVPRGGSLGKAARDAVLTVDLRLGVQSSGARVLDSERHAIFRGSTRVLLRNRVLNP